MSSISTRASIRPQHSSSPGAATDARQGALPLFEERCHLPLAERAPHDDHDVERVWQLAENCAKTLANQASRATPLHAVANLARRSNPQAKRRPRGAPLHDEDQTVSVDANSSGLNLEEFSALSDAVGSGWRVSPGPNATGHFTFRRSKPSGASGPCGDDS